MPRNLFLFIIYVTVYPHIGFSQTNQSQITMFSSRLYNPVTIEVQKTGKTISFTAQNNSWYPYQIELQFSSFSNLTPIMSNFKSVALPGKTNLFRLSVQDETYPPNYSYSMRYMIGDPHKKPELLYPYLVPLNQGKEIKLSETDNDADTLSFRTVFNVTAGDTVRCMRKGIVTVTPASDDKFDRILRRSIEVLHADGTIATYSISETDNILVIPGQMVYPLQPLAIIKNPSVFLVHVFQLNGLSGLKSFDFKYEHELTTGDKEKIVIVNHAPDIIEKELTSRERKRLAKGELF